MKNFDHVYLLGEINLSLQGPRETLFVHPFHLA